MGLAVNIEELVHGQVIEWDRLEFKAGWNPEAILHTLCAFANDINNWGGGYIIVGVEEQNGRPVLPPSGLNPDNIDSYQGRLVELCHHLQPGYLPISQPSLIQEKHILVIYAPAGDMRPYSAPSGLGARGTNQRFHYIRSGSRTIKARDENLRKLQELTARIPFDDRIQSNAKLSDLNLGLIRNFLQEIRSELFDESAHMPFIDLCRQLAIVKGPDEALRPVNVGLMFFCEHPENFFGRSWIEVIIRKDEAGKEFTEKYFKGPLHVQLRDALGYIRSNIIAERIRKVSGQAEARRFFNFPFAALEEALANAVYHKSYELSKPIEIQIWPDRIEILSFPGPVPPVNAQVLAENRRIVARDYRNRRVGDFLKELHLTEGRGTGIPSMRRALAANGSPEPTLETDDFCTHFLCTLSINPEFANQVSDEVSDEVNDQVSDEEELILGYCKTPKSKAEILTKIGLANHTYNYQRHIEPILAKGWLQMTIPENAKHRNQRYVTTSVGQEILKQNAAQ